MTSIEYYGLSTFYGLIAIVGIILNLLIMLALTSKRELRHRRANRFLCSLCLSDFFTCVYSVPYHLIHLHPCIYSSILNLNYCHFTQFFIYIFAFSSSLCLAGVCVDRYVAITRPFLYLTDKFSKISIILLLWPWIQSVGTSVPAAVLPVIEVLNSTGFPCGMNSSWETIELWSILSVINIIIPFICILASCTVVFRVARRQLHEIQMQVPGSTSENSAEETSSKVSEGAFENNPTVQKHITTRKIRVVGAKLYRDATRRRFHKNFREEAKITFATVAVVVGFMVAWTPYLVTRLLYLIGVVLSNDIHMFGSAFVLANSAWNPVLIILLRRDIRESVKSLCHITIR